MATALLDSVDRFTRLAGHNRTAMLLFRLDGGSRFAINVFKVREVLRCPPLARLPTMHELVAGAVDYRGRTLPVIDLIRAMNYPPLQDPAEAHLIVSEFSRSVQAFLVRDVERIVHCDGADMETPGHGLGYGARVSAVTRIDGALVAVVDVEQILAEVNGAQAEVSSRLRNAAQRAEAQPRRVLVADDSAVARRQLVEVLKQMEIECVVAHDGREALAMLREQAALAPEERVALVISDIEMPALDGYALTRAIREDAALAPLKVVLHSSLSGGFNEAMVRDVGADRFVAKFQPDLLAASVLELLAQVRAQRG
ncbi:MAG: chemotaxis protein [Mizugakiibacter sp.]|uniref:chemotaxis protein n=1 Tax=Mizugakiibacter sp. TaxID=1972610 RepID=UPI0031C16E17|nr:chemotaxis protein [Xanthomonadaceae bacterium]